MKKTVHLDDFVIVLQNITYIAKMKGYYEVHFIGGSRITIRDDQYARILEGLKT